MTAADLYALLPLLILAGTAVVVAVVIAFHRSHAISAGLTFAGLAAAFVALPFVHTGVARPVTELLVVDGYALFYTGLVIVATFFTCLLSYDYLERAGGHGEEFYVLLLLAALGSAVLVSSAHFAALFLGLEILSVSLYVLIAYLPESRLGIEAGLKYLIPAAISSAFLLFGIALVYAHSGSLQFAGLTELPASADTLEGALVLIGFGLIVTGIGFKLALVPFHLWTPDVYEGAPAPVTAFVATVSKGGVFALLLRYFTQVELDANGSLFQIFALIAVASMLAGNLLALLQDNVKRILAYSSIAHLGYVLVAFLAAGAYRETAVTLYLAAYFVTILGAFGVVAALSGAGREADDIEDYRGLLWRRPWPAAVLTINLLSLAGIPLTAGFVGKFSVLAAGIESSLWGLVLVLVVSSAIGLYYYLRIVVVMLREPAVESGVFAPMGLPGTFVLAALTVLLVGLGVYPTTLIALIQSTVAQVG